MIMYASLQDKALGQLHINNMGIEKTRMLTCELIYLNNINTDIAEVMKSSSTYLDFQAT